MTGVRRRRLLRIRLAAVSSSLSTRPRARATVALLLVEHLARRLTVHPGSQLMAGEARAQPERGKRRGPAATADVASVERIALALQHIDAAARSAAVHARHLPARVSRPLRRWESTSARPLLHGSCSVSAFAFGLLERTDQHAAWRDRAVCRRHRRP